MVIGLNWHYSGEIRTHLLILHKILAFAHRFVGIGRSFLPLPSSQPGQPRRA